MKNNYRTKKENIKTAKGRTNSSANWLRRHINDPYVQLAKKEGFVSRAAFKMLGIDEKYKLIAKANSIVDLGAAPGSWLQVIAKLKKANVPLIGVDLLDIALNLPNLVCIKGDFLDEQIQNDIVNHFKSKPDLIVSDMAASASGDRQLDHIRSSELVISVLEFIDKNLQLKGNAVIKSIRGGEEEDLITMGRKLFSHIKLFKPEASYKDSSEIYIICLNKL